MSKAQPELAMHKAAHHGAARLSGNLVCYRLDSLTSRAVILVRKDNNQRYEVFPGGHIPRLTMEEGRCVDTGDTVALLGFNVDRGSVRLANGQSLESAQTFVIGALVDGRAWLKTEKWLLHLLLIGVRFLPGYGRVVDIDVIRGIVRTSSGKVIQYGADER